MTALRDHLHKAAHRDNPEKASKRKIFSEDSQTFIACMVTVAIIFGIVTAFGLIPEKKAAPSSPAATTTAK